MAVEFEPLTQNTITAYCQVGTQSYKEHYLHLWQRQDPTPYLSTSFIEEVVQRELNDHNCRNFLVKSDGENAGILKISIDYPWGQWSAKDALYLHRIYLLSSATGKNLGTSVLNFVEKMAQKFSKKIVWLETMKKGRAKAFYQNNGYQIIGESAVELPGVLPSESGMWVVAKVLKAV